jgi:hypothetical protein
MTTEGEVRATSDLMLQMLDRLRGTEEVKRGLNPGSREFADRAYEVVELAREVTRWSEHQLRIANELLARPDESTATLRDTPKRRLDEVLAEWRQAEIRLSHASPGSDDYRHATELVERLRSEYRILQDAKMGNLAG